MHTWLTRQEEGGRLCACSANKDHSLSGEKGKLFLAQVKQYKCDAPGRSINTWHFDKNCSFSVHQLVKAEHFLQVFLFCHCFVHLYHKWFAELLTMVNLKPEVSVQCISRLSQKANSKVGFFSYVIGIIRSS